MFHSIVFKVALALIVSLGGATIAQDAIPDHNRKQAVEERIREYWLESNEIRRSRSDDSEPYLLTIQAKPGVKVTKPGPLPAFEARWVKEFKSMLTGHVEGDVTQQIELQLARIYWNNQQWNAMGKLYLDCIRRDPTHPVVEKFTRSIHIVLESDEVQEDPILDALKLVATLEKIDASRFLYALGYWAELEKDMDKAKSTYRELLTRFPEGRYAGMARRRLTEVTTLRVGEPAPTFEITDIDGKVIALSGLRDKIVVLHFWATWCGPCKPHLPYLEELHEIAERGQLALLSISIDEDERAYTEFVSNMRADGKFLWPQICDFQVYAGDIAKKYNLAGVPVTYVIGRDGLIIAKNLHGEELNERVRRELTPSSHTADESDSPATLVTFIRCVDEGSIEFHVGRTDDEMAAERFSALFEAISNARPRVDNTPSKALPKSAAKDGKTLAKKKAKRIGAAELQQVDAFELLNRCINDGTLKVKFREPDGPEQQKRLQKVIAALVDASKRLE